MKICGVTSVADAVRAAELGADAVGFNFFPRSPRHTDETTAAAIVAALPATATPVMLSVEEDWSVALLRLERLRAATVPVHVQVHAKVLTPCPAPAAWIPAFAVENESSLRAIETFLASCPTKPSAILVDAHVIGGTGRTLPWELLAGFSPGVPLILAGGLTPENVAEAVRRVRPHMVDVASGVESAPGKKDPEAMRRFIDAARSV